MAAFDVPQGTTIEIQHLAFKKPGDGIPASQYKDLLGCKTSREIKKNKRQYQTYSLQRDEEIQATLRLKRILQ